SGNNSSATAASATVATAMASSERQLANALLLQRLLDGLQTLLEGAALVYREQQQVALMSGGQRGLPIGPTAGGLAACSTSDCAFWSGWSDSAVLQAVCCVLCSAASAVLPGALRGDTALQARFNALWPQLMALLGHNNPEVALSCVSFWQDTYLAQLIQVCSSQTQQGGAGAGAGPSQGVTTLQSHLPLLAQLLTALVSRAALGPEAAAVATADARDLPEEVRMVRRELGATMRDLVGLVGLGHVAAFLERMISEHATQLGATEGCASGSTASGAAPAGLGPTCW
ncbi:hypothetical protein Vretifemale_5251, partial [Volvox reticuliferus]